MNFNSFDKKTDLIERLSQKIANDLQKAIDKNQKATLIVSGGSTPKPLFEKLCIIDIKWEKVTIGLCDERWINPNHKDSNAKFVKTYLLQDKASKAKFVEMFIDEITTNEAEQECSKNIQNILPIDTLILGMGGDAHTASLFPNNPKLDEAFDLKSKLNCIAIEPNNALYSRMSLNLKTILSAKNLYLHFESKNKLDVFQKAQKSNDAYIYPIVSVLKNLEVYYAK